VQKLTEDQPSISVHALYRAGALHDGAVTKWDWAGRIVELRAHGTRAEFVIDGHDVVVPITWHQGPLGGSWPSWNCPRQQCRRGAYLLYPIGHQLGCRLCARLGYAIQLSRSPAPWQVRRLRQQLGADLRPFVPLPPRSPRRGRSAALYDRIAREIAAAECRMLTAIDGMTVVLERRVKARERQQKRRGNSVAGRA
jgi:hypothetical protein